MEMKACFILAFSSSVYRANRRPLLCERLLQISTNTQWKVKGHDGLDHPSVNVLFLDAFMCNDLLPYSRRNLSDSVNIKSNLHHHYRKQRRFNLQKGNVIWK